MKGASDSSHRFSNRVETYQRYRPGYPEPLIELLLESTGLGAGARVADIGSGTGIFTRLLLECGLTVYGVEPNQPMRDAAQQALSDFESFRSIAASAENTGLDDSSIDLVTAAQAFHWFNNEAARNEFGRVLRPDGKLALIWNKRKISQAFQQAYADILRARAPEYGKVNHMNLHDEEIAAFFAPGQMQIHVFENSQRLNFKGLIGRLRSASYCPPEESAEYRELRADLEKLFEQFATEDSVDFNYETRLYLGPIDR